MKFLYLNLLNLLKSILKKIPTKPPFPLIDKKNESTKNIVRNTEPKILYSIVKNIFSMITKKCLFLIKLIPVKNIVNEIKRKPDH